MKRLIPTIGFDVTLFDDCPTYPMAWLPKIKHSSGDFLNGHRIRRAATDFRWLRMHLYLIWWS